VITLVVIVSHKGFDGLFQLPGVIVFAELDLFNPTFSRAISRVSWTSCAFIVELSFQARM
jgi:hypothetical protein